MRASTPCPHCGDEGHYTTMILNDPSSAAEELCDCPVGRVLAVDWDDYLEARGAARWENRPEAVQHEPTGPMLGTYPARDYREQGRV